MKSEYTYTVDQFIGIQSNFRILTYYNYSIFPHDHTFYEINVILSGSGTHRIGKHSVSCGMGDLFVIKPGIVHSYTEISGLDILHILITPQFLAKCNAYAVETGLADMMTFYNCDYSAHPSAFYVNLKMNELGRIKNELEALKSNGDFDFPDCEPFKELCMMRFLFYIQLLHDTKMANPQLMVKNSSSFSAAPPETKYIKNDDRYIVETMEFISANYKERITVDELCARAHMSRSTFLRKFKTVSGMSPMRYLMQCRKEAALKMLSEGYNISKTKVAAECGFYDLSHMERAINPRKKG